MIAVCLEPGLGLFLTNVRLVEHAGHVDLEYGLGPLGVAFWAFQFLLFLITLLLFFGLAVRSHAAYRLQGWILIVAFLAPVIAAGVMLVSPDIVVDPTPPTFLVTGVLVTWGVYRSDFLHVVPVDRDRTLDRVRGAVVVLDSRNRIVDVNRTAENLFGEPFAIGDDADAVLRRTGFERTVNELDDGTAVTLSSDERRRYEVNRDEIETWFGDRRGAVLTLYDVTERWRAERRL